MISILDIPPSRSSFLKTSENVAVPVTLILDTAPSRFVGPRRMKTRLPDNASKQELHGTFIAAYTSEEHIKTTLKAYHTLKDTTIYNTIKDTTHLEGLLHLKGYHTLSHF